jgi:plasmid stabilization system protein ParE
MSFKVVILHSAEHDLKELRHYLISRFSTQAWRSTYQHLQSTVAQLATSPYAGVVPDEIQQLNLRHYRQVLCGMNRVIYEVRENTVYIHIIADTRKDLQSLLIKRLLRMNE